MSLPDGIYNIREVTYKDPNPGVGGMYITGNGPDAALTTAAQCPPFFESQCWKVTHAGSGPNEYTLEFVGNTTQPATYRFSWRGENPGKNEPVVLNTDLKRFTLTPVKIPGAVAPIYLIRPVINLIGVDIFVGAHQGGPGEVQYKVLLVGEPEESRPVWEFTPIPRD